MADNNNNALSSLLLGEPKVITKDWMIAFYQAILPYLGGGSGGGGTSDYEELDNKPTINNIELIGNKTSTQLHLLDLNDIIANPQEEATEMLTKIKIGNTVYSLPQGSGGSTGFTVIQNGAQDLSNRNSQSMHTLSNASQQLTNNAIPDQYQNTDNATQATTNIHNEQSYVFDDLNEEE